MMRKRQFYQRWKRRFRAGLADSETLLVRCLEAGDADTVHELRVTLRRTRLLSLVGTPVLGKPSAMLFRQWALKVAAALSQLRDCDVTLEWLRAHFPALERLHAVQVHRTGLWRRARRKLLPLARLPWKQVRRWESTSAKTRKLRRKFLKESARIQERLSHEAARFEDLDSAALHEFRRTLRRLRYLRELDLSRREQRCDQILKRLVSFQEALGEMQNCLVVRTFFASEAGFRWRHKVVRSAELQERQWLRRAEGHLTEFLRKRAPVRR